MNNIYIASAVILNTKKELLLVRKKDSKFFQLPGGKISENETKEKTVIREIKEEINLNITEKQLTFIGDHQTEAVNEKNTIVHGFIFLIALEKNCTINIANEIVEFAWLNKSNYENYKWAHLAEEFVQPIWLKLIS